MRRVLALSVVSSALVVLPWAAPANANGTGTVTTLTGDGVLDGILATGSVVSPWDSVTAADGTVYIADATKHRVRAVAPDGTISTFAGTGVMGFAGDGGPATAAKLWSPTRVALAGDGDLLVAEDGSQRVRRIDTVTGIITTIAGNGGTGIAAPDDDATTQPINPDDIVYDTATSRVLIADPTAGRVWAVTEGGALESLVESPAVSSPVSLAIGPDGALFVGGGNRIRRVEGSTVTVVAGGGEQNATDGTNATAAAISTPQSLAVGDDGTVYFGDPAFGAPGHSKIRSFTVGGNLASVPGAPCYELAEMDQEGRLVVGCDGRLWRYDSNTWVHIAGQGGVTRVPDGTAAANAGFSQFGTTGVVGSNGDVVFGHGYSIYRLHDGIVHVEAGTGSPGAGTPDGTVATAAAITPCNVSALSDGTVVFGEATRVRAVVGGALATLVGGPGATTSFTEGMPAASFATVYCPKLAPAPDGDLFVGSGDRLFRLDASAGTLHLVSGNLCNTFGKLIDSLTASGTTVVATLRDGFTTDARTAFCQYDTVTGTAREVFADHATVNGLHLAADGRLFFATTTSLPFATALRVLGTDGTVTTLAKGGTDRERTTTLDALAFFEPRGLFVDGDGAVIWQDASTGWIRRLAPGWSVDPVDTVTGLTASITYPTMTTASVTLTWTPPATPHSRIYVEYYDAANAYHAGAMAWQWLGAGATTVTIPNLDAGKQYVFDVRPTRDWDQEWAPHAMPDVVPAYTAPSSAPGVYARSSGTGQTAALVWTAPGGAAVVTEVRIAEGTTPPATLSDGTRVYRGTGTGALAQPLTPGTTYSVSVFGVDAGDNAVQSSTQTFVAGAAPKVTATSGPAYGGATGSTATFTWSTSGGATSFFCARENGVPFACSGGSVTLTGMTAGEHSLSVTPVGPFGNGFHDGWVFIVDKTVPTITMKTPSSPFTLSTSATVTYAGADAQAGVGSYDVRYRRAAFNGSFGGYITPSGWSGTTATSRTLSGLTRGNTYCFSARARDKVGNVSGWSGEKCVATALDDRSLSVSSGWTRATSGLYYAGTYSRSVTTGRTISRTGAVFSRIAIVATRCPTCGTVRVYHNGTLLKTISLVATKTQYRVVIVVGAYSLRSGTITVKTVFSKAVHVDGLAVSRV